MTELVTDNPEAGPAPAPAPVKIDRRLIDGAVAPTLVRFAAPLLATNMMLSASGSWGSIWVSHVVGPDALTAMSNSWLFIMLMIGMVQGVGTTAGIAVAQAIGARDLDSAKRAAANALVFALVASFVVGGLGIAFAPQLLTAISLPPEALAAAVIYFRVTCLSLPGLFILVFMMMLVRGTGDARTPFIFTVSAIVIGMAATPAFLIGIPGIPPMGIAGAAWSGVLANTAAAVALARYIYWKRLPLALWGKDLHHLKPDLGLIWMLIKRGTPVALETLVVQGAYFTLLAMVNVEGAATAAGYSAAAQLWAYVQMPAVALATSMSSMAAMNIGAGRWDRIDTIAFRGCLVAGVFTIATTGLLYLLGDIPLRLFLPAGGEALEVARSVNNIVLWGWVALAVTLGLNAMVRANGAMLAPTIIFATTMWVLRVPFATLLKPILGVDAIWWSFPVGAVSSAVLAYAYYRWGGWRRRGLLLAPSPANA